MGMWQKDGADDVRRLVVIMRCAVGMSVGWAGYSKQAEVRRGVSWSACI